MPPCHRTCSSIGVGRHADARLTADVLDRHTASACLRIETIWVSVNFDFFMEPPGLETMPESSTSLLSTFWGSLRTASSRPRCGWGKSGVNGRCIAQRAMALRLRSPPILWPTLSPTSHDAFPLRRPRAHMSDASRCATVRTESVTERWQPWIAALVSLLVHVLLLLALLYSSKMTLAPPASSSSGGARGEGGLHR